MITYLRKQRKVPFDNLYQDGNNPRLALEQTPGYQNKRILFSKEQREELTRKIWKTYDVKELIEAILAHGWMEIDAIVVWLPPREKDRYIVVEGNRRITALRQIRNSNLLREEKKLSVLKKKRTVSKIDIENQERLVEHIRQIVSDTNELSVVPIAAKSATELERLLPRILAVRHISGAKSWGNYAEDLWLLNRYHHLFREKFGNDPLRWEQSIINRVADDASLGKTKAKRRLQSCSIYSHFRTDWEDMLPEGDIFRPRDYYLFECIIKKPWLREQFEIGQDSLQIPTEKEEVLYKWVFQKPRGKDEGPNTDAKENPNNFYRHENVIIWDKMHKYDDEYGTGFAQRFDTSSPDAAPLMSTVEAQWLSHQSQRAPDQLLEELLGKLKELKADTLHDRADFLKDKLEAIADQANMYIEMIDASQSPRRKRKKRA